MYKSKAIAEAEARMVKQVAKPKATKSVEVKPKEATTRYQAPKIKKQPPLYTVVQIKQVVNRHVGNLDD